MSGQDQDDSERRSGDIAIIGMAGRFPGAPNIDVFWENLKNGVEAVRFFSDEELREAGESPSKMAASNYVAASPVLDDIDKFDAGFFGFSPRDASVMDPAHRLFLEVAWAAVEHAGHTALPEEGVVGVWAGSGAPNYMTHNLRTNPDLMDSMGEFLVRHTGNDMNFLATRASYDMDLRGPSINVQTACSSALVSVHMACRSLNSGECDMALAGGSTVLVPQGRGYLYEEGEILSPDGHCRPFDAKSAGTVFGSGSGCVVLRRLQDALDDGDTVHAVIRGSAINNDGSVRVGFLAPGVDGQALCISQALEASGLDPDDISYVETHGTGTKVGDPIEVEGLTQAFRRGTDKNQFCAIGSVKSNIGHLGEAAGVASLIKAVMALKHRHLPKSLGYEAPNPDIDFENSPFFVNAESREWKADGLLRCGVTSLGAGGTNCHLVLEEPPAPEPTEGGRSAQLVCLSAKSLEALDAASTNLAAHLERHPDLDMADVAYTLHEGRRDMGFRRAFAATSSGEATDLLRSLDPQRVVTHVHEGRQPSVVFMFPGGGAQYSRMGFDLYENEEVYREAVDECMDIVNPGLGRDLRALMFAPAEKAEAATRELERPSLTLPSLFSTSYALAKLFESWGVEPDAMIGHSMGEYVAACLSGVITLKEALDLVCLRGRLFEKTAAGGMMAVSMSEADARARMPSTLSIAAINSPGLCVVSGPVADIDAFEKELSEQASGSEDTVDTTRVHIDVAAHSVMLDPILDEFRAFCRTVDFQAPEVPYVSNLTGKWITDGEATDPEYWVKHLRNSVRFADGIDTLLEDDARVLVEVGPGRTLSSLARAQGKRPKASFNSMRHPREEASDLEFALRTFGRIWASGAQPDWLAFYDGQLRQRLPLPTYAFQSESYWVEPGEAVATRGAAVGELKKRPDADDWFHVLSWKRTAPPPPAETRPTKWLIFTDRGGVGTQLAERLGGELVTTVIPGSRFVRTCETGYEVDPQNPAHFRSLIEELHERGRMPEHVVYLWTLGLRDQGRSALRKVGRSLGSVGRAAMNQLGVSEMARGSRDQLFNFWCLFWLGKGLDAVMEPVKLSVVSTQMQKFGDEPTRPEKATLLGPVYTIPHECPQIQTRSIDVPEFASFTKRGQRILDQLAAELLGSDADAATRVVAYRGPDRWVRAIEPARLASAPLAAEAEAEAEAEERPWLREGGVYLITGGLGGIGLEVAKHLAKAKPVKLVLFGRKALPPESEWRAWVATHGEADTTSQRILAVEEIRSFGAEVLVGQADVADRAAMAQLVADAKSRFGAIHGVVHAAGVMDDALLQLKTDESAEKVLAPKVLGTLVLDDVLAEDELDFFVLFSSVASFLGLPGQVDYTAANAFLDAFACERSARAAGRTVVVNWNAWQGVGMAAALAEAEARGWHDASRHPLFVGYTDRADHREFIGDLSIADHWLLAEHRIKGADAVIPGTGFIELARAALEEIPQRRTAEIRDVSFLTPLRVRPDETRRLHVKLSADTSPATATDSSAQRFVIYTDTESDPHVTGAVRYVDAAAPAARDVAELSSRCDQREESPSGGFLNQVFVDFGSRWANIRRIRYGSGEALLELALDESLADDLAGFRLHPALLDMATGGAQPLIPGFDRAKDFYVPLAYGRIRVFGDMPAKLFSHVRVLEGSGKGLAYFDVTLLDEAGLVVAEIERFTMKRLDATSSMTDAGPRDEESGLRRSTKESHLEALLREAILPEEGVAVLDRVMAQNASVQIVASTVDVELWSRRLDRDAKAILDGDAGQNSGPTFSRPNLGTPYVAPRDAAEALVAKIWSEMLGVDDIGVNDDFHDLGGQSLLAVRMVERIRKETGTSVPLTSLFDSPTVAAIAANLEVAEIESGQAGPRAVSSLVAVKATGSRPALFMPHGVGGTVHWGYANVARHLSPEQPVYGLQIGDEAISNFKEMAAHYVATMREHQPEGPYFLAGYCYGGNLAYEMATQLRSVGQEVALLAMIEAWPVNMSFGEVKITPTYLARFARNLPTFVAEFASRPAVDQIAAVKGKLKGLRARFAPAPHTAVTDSGAESGGQASALPAIKPPRGADMLDLSDLLRYSDGEVDIWTRNLHALWADTPNPYDGNVTVIRARRQPLTSPHDPEMGWGELAGGGVDAHVVHGSHFSIVDEPDAKAVGAILETCIARALADGHKSALSAQASTSGEADGSTPSRESDESLGATGSD